MKSELLSLVSYITSRLTNDIRYTVLPRTLSQVGSGGGDGLHSGVHGAEGGSGKLVLQLVFAFALFEGRLRPLLLLWGGGRGLDDDGPEQRSKGND